MPIILALGIIGLAAWIGDAIKNSPHLKPWQAWLATILSSGMFYYFLYQI